MVEITTPFTGTYPSGKQLQITAPASVVSGGRTYNFSRWEDNSTNRVRSVTITGTIAIVATYVIVPQFTLTVVAGTGGTSTPSTGTHPYDQGTVVPISATPSADYNFAYWLIDGVQSSATSVTMNANHTIQPVFVAKTITLTVTAGTGGTVNPSGAQTVSINSTYPFVATPNTTPYPGYTFNHWDLNGTNLGSTPTLNLKITSAMSGQTLRALFTQTPFTTITLTVARSGAGTVNPYGTVTLNVDPTTPSTFVASDVAGSGFVFDHWEFSWDAAQRPTAKSITVYITQALQGATITAVFLPIMYTVTIDSSPIKVTMTVTEMN